MSKRAPHFSYPFRLNGSSFAETEQDTAAEVEDCIEAVLRTEQGSRVDDPEFGVPDAAFAQVTTELSAEPYVTAVEEQEPRAQVLGSARLEELTETHVTIESEGVS